MILPDFEIRNLIQEQSLVYPYNSDQLNPASYDVRLGDMIIQENDLEVSVVDNYSYYLQPGAFILAGTQEIFNLPDNICAQFTLKSSMARQGLTHNMAGWCDPGWHNSVLTMELCNLNQRRVIELKPGMKIGQMVFMRLSASCENPYTGRYNNDLTVKGAKKELDDTKA